MKRVLLCAVLLSCLSAVPASALTFEERVEAQRAIERVYYNHRIWPKENPGPKPSFEEMVPEEVIRAKVERYLLESSVLSSYWHRPITGEQLQSEMSRMMQQTKDSEALNDLFSALRFDPTLIAECLTREALADRLARNWYAYDSKIHESRRLKAELLRTQIQSGAVMDLREVDKFDVEVRYQSSGRRRDKRTLNGTDFRTVEKEFPSDGKVSEVRELADSFIVRQTVHKTRSSLSGVVYRIQKLHIEDWLSEQAVVDVSIDPGFVFHIPTSQQSPNLTTPTTPESWKALWYIPNQRNAHTAVWTGSEMIIWGGLTSNGATNTGGRYDPVTDSWSPTGSVGAPQSRYSQTAVWTGNRMIIWGGRGPTNNPLRTGAVYNPALDDGVQNAWIATTLTSAPSIRYDHSAIWTGSEMIVWGGTSVGTLGDGGRYNLQQDSWTAIPTTVLLQKRQAHTAVWTGSEMIVWGGGQFPFSVFGDGARYNPANGLWTAMAIGPSARADHSAIWTGDRMIVWGGFDFVTGATDTGAIYMPSLNSWSNTTTSGAPTARSGHTAVWSGTEMIVWGSGSNTGGRYNPGNDSWIPTSVNVNVPTPRANHSIVWTGNEMIVWGGRSSFTAPPENSGGRYQPATDQWTPTTLSNAPTARATHTAVWTGIEMIVWGGANDTTGGRYNPTLDQWAATSLANAPSARGSHTAVWTGTRMIIWGGGLSGVYTGDGRRYDPAIDSWSDVSAAGAPSARAYHTAVWTGTEMIVWGGTPDDISFFGDGARYDPQSNQWFAVSNAGAPTPRTGHIAVWTGNRMIIWGGTDGGDCCDSVGFAYNPIGNSWSPLPASPGGGYSRFDSRAVWTGGVPTSDCIGCKVALFIWGGDYNNDGFRYDPNADAWSSLPAPSGPPNGRNAPGLIWTGKTMIVWDGDPSTQNGGVFYPDTPPVSIPHITTSTNDDQILVLGVGELLTVDGTLSSDGSNPFNTTPNHDELDSLISYEWDLDGDSVFGDPVVCQTSNVGVDATGASLELGDFQLPPSLAAPGVHTVFLRVTDELGTRRCNGLNLTVVDGIAPVATVISPAGGESWTYSPDTVNREKHLVVWSASDNFPPLARVRLSYTTGGAGGTYTCIADSSGASCAANGLTPTVGAYLWSMPTQGEATGSGQTFPTAIARIKVEVWDGSNNTAAATSANNFYVIQPTATAIDTLVLWDSARICSKYDAIHPLCTCSNWANDTDCTETQALSSKLGELKDHSKVNGFLLDLNTVPAVQSAYTTWDGDPLNQTKANAVATAVRNYVLGQVSTFTAAKYLILVGDDFQIPQYRMADGASFYTEAQYKDEVTLSPNTTVGAAISQGFFLTDNYYSELEEPAPAAGPDLPGHKVYLNDLYTGRLVETPAQMEDLINVFLEQDGQLNITGSSDKILIAGHDFLYDSAKQIRDDYAAAGKTTDCLLYSTGGSTPCVDQTYNAVNLQAQMLSVPPHRIMNLNDHANHFSFSTPQGSLNATTLDGVGTEMRGSILYSPGCHSGLNVPPGELAHPLDMPEEMAKKKVMAYIGNTGYGWGLRNGTGLSERLMDLMTGQILQNGTIAVGRAMADAKRRYHVLESRYDVFDEKVEHELTLYGIPNYLIVTQLASAPEPAKAELPKPDGPDKGCANGICMNKRLVTTSLPIGVTELNMSFDFSSAYQPLTTVDGTYYTLNGLASGETGEPIQPHFAYDSALSGTNAHGVVFTGGIYQVFTPYNPVIAVPRSTNTDSGEGPIPARRGVTPDIRVSSDDSGLPTGAPPLTNMVVHTGIYDSNTEKRFDTMQFVVYYSDEVTNQDVDAPVVTDPGLAGFHTVSGNVAGFSVQVSDASGVYRVLVTYEDTVTTQWKSKDLSFNAGTGNWEGSIVLTADTLYFVQAVDMNGNVGTVLDSGQEDLSNDCPGGPGTCRPYGSTWRDARVYSICYYLLDATSASFPSMGGTGSVNVTCLQGCAWAVVSNDSWITITSGGSGSGNGTVLYTVAANPTGSQRIGTISIQGVTFTVTQSGATCTYSLNPTSVNYGSTGGSGSFNVNTLVGCPWIGVSNDSWITITGVSSGIGSGTVQYIVAANPLGSGRTGTMTVQGQTFTVTQSGAPCVNLINPTNANYSAGGGSGSVGVTALTGCGWTAASNDSWITVTSGSSGNGNGTVQYSVAANPGASLRTGTMTIAGSTFTVIQAGTACEYSINPESQSFGAAGGSGSSAVTALPGCAWTAVSNDTWITITSGSSGNGNGTVQFTVAANPGGVLRTGTMTVAGHTFFVAQDGLACVYTIAPDNQSFAAAGGSGSIAVTVPSGCSWTAVSSDTWLTVTSGSSGNGNGSVNYTVAANAGSSPRTATIMIATETFTATQAAAALFFDDFEDNNVSDWTPTKGLWSAAAGKMVGTFTKKADNFPNLFPLPGCGICTVEADLQMDTDGTQASVLGWYTDKKNYVELRLMGDKDKVMLKQYTSAGTAAKQVAPFAVNAATNYHVTVTYNGVMFVVDINGGALGMTVPTAVTPAGRAGFRVKSTTGANSTGRFGEIIVY